MVVAGTGFKSLCYSVFAHLERQAQRHLNLPWRSNRFIGYSQSAEVRAHVQRRNLKASVAGRYRRGQRGGTLSPRKALEVDVLAHVVDRNVETRRIGEVEYIEGVLQGIALGQCRLLYKG